MSRIDLMEELTQVRRDLTHVIASDVAARQELAVLRLEIERRKAMELALSGRIYRAFEVLQNLAERKKR